MKISALWTGCEYNTDRHFSSSLFFFSLTFLTQDVALVQYGKERAQKPSVVDQPSFVNMVFSKAKIIR